MYLEEATITAQELLRIFHRDEPALFLGAAFNTVALICVGVCLVRRRLNALLLWLAVFAHLYGQRLWLDTDILQFSLGQNPVFHRIHWAISFLVPVPAFFFFQAAGLLPRRSKVVTGVLSLTFLGMAAVSFFLGHITLLHTINNVIVVLALVGILIRAYRQGSHDRDFVILRRGLLCFAVVALWDNLGGAARLRMDLEPYGFAVLLASLGYVAARRTFERDEQWNELQNELAVARNIQFSLLPAEFPASPHFRIAAHYVPMTAVAGDFYDYVATGEMSAGLLIADVSGHGIPAALIASMVKMAAKSQFGLALHPGQLLTGMNRALCGNTQGQYVTAAYASLDASRAELRYAAAGHPAMFLLRGGEITEVAENGLLLAALDSVEYTERTLSLAAGDRIVLYTDGLLEARNSAKRLFGEDALMAAVRSTASLPPKEAANEVIRQVQAWSPGQEDDLTILVCDYKGLLPVLA